MILTLAAAYSSIGMTHFPVKLNVCQLTSQLKPAINTALRRLLDPIQNEFNASLEWQEVFSPLLPSTPRKPTTNTPQIEKNAYPAEAPKEKKQKVKKDKGSKYPGGAKGSETQAEEGKDAADATTGDVGKSASEAMGKLAVE